MHRIELWLFVYRVVRWFDAVRVGRLCLVHGCECGYSRERRQVEVDPDLCNLQLLVELWSSCGDFIEKLCCDHS